MQAVLSDDGVGAWLGEPDPPEEPLTLEASVPPHRLRLGSLRPHTPYHLRVACSSVQGLSPWTHWLPTETPQGGKSRWGWGWPRLFPATCHQHQCHHVCPPCSCMCTHFSPNPLSMAHGRSSPSSSLGFHARGWHEMPVFSPLAPCPDLLGTGVQSRKRRGRCQLPLLPVIQHPWAPPRMSAPGGMGARFSCLGSSLRHPCREPF